MSRVTRVQSGFSTGARLILATVMIVSGWNKVTDLPASVRAVRAYELLPEAIVRFVGHALPVGELILGAMLVLGLLTRLSAGAFSLLMVVFIIGIASAWARGLSIDCGCFGGGGPVAAGETQYLRDIVRDIALLAVSLALMRWPRSAFALDGRLGLHPVPRRSDV